MKHIVSVIVDTIPTYAEGFIENQWLYYSEEEFITMFANKVLEFYLHPENEIKDFDGCVEWVWFDCCIQENNNQTPWDDVDNEDLKYRDLYSIKVNAYLSFQDYKDGWEMEDWQGWMIDFYSKEHTHEHLETRTLMQECIKQWETAYGMIFP